MNVNDYFKYKKRVVVKNRFFVLTASTDWKYEPDEN